MSGPIIVITMHVVAGLILWNVHKGNKAGEEFCWQMYSGFLSFVVLGYTVKFACAAVDFIWEHI